MKHLACLLVLLAMGTQIYAEVPKLFNYSGKLTDKDNNVLPSGKYNMKFILWDHATSTNTSHEVWEEEHYYTNGVDIFGGGYNVVLGGLEELPDFDKPYWLEMIVSINEKDEKFNRQKMVSTPYAIRAEYANQMDDNSVTSDKIKDRTITNLDIAIGAVQTMEIADGNVTNAKIANNAISSSKITLNAIQSHMGIKRVVKSDGQFISDADLPAGFSRSQCWAIASLREWNGGGDIATDDNWTKHIHCFVDNEWFVKCGVGYFRGNNSSYTETGGSADVLIFGFK